MLAQVSTRNCPSLSLPGFQVRGSVCYLLHPEKGEDGNAHRLIEQAPTVIVNSPISVAIVLTPFLVPYEFV